MLLRKKTTIQILTDRIHCISSFFCLACNTDTNVGFEKKTLTREGVCILTLHFEYNKFSYFLLITVTIFAGFHCFCDFLSSYTRVCYSILFQSVRQFRKCQNGSVLKQTILFCIQIKIS